MKNLSSKKFLLLKSCAFVAFSLCFCNVNNFTSYLHAAEPGSFYVKLGSGLVISPNIKIEVIPSDSTLTKNYDNIINYGSINDKIFRGAIGYYADSDIRTELSLSYFQFQDKINAPGEVTLKNFVGMLHGYYDINTEGFFTPYIHAGIGARQSSAKYVSPTDGVKDITGTTIPFLVGTLDSGTSYQLAYSGGFGFNLNLTKRLMASVEYSISNGQDQSVKKLDTEKMEIKATSSLQHSVSASVALIF
ncbi:outer membrane protein [Lyticum sinuosum]|uniref:Porin family protein n=1 Tax=Lyticum sinuosum TaxID=1332059 RepID=A0AAE4VLV5_9RICK|nr:outer membrane beta-barrel protein [Lyticum sinuosum]MDZ5760899.1 Porin family protein [Lyticum sinuosum]